MKHITLILNQSQMDQLKQLYQNHLLKVEQPYIAFVAHHNNVRINAFTSGKVLLQGEEINQELVAIKAFLKIKNYPAIGSDEVGTGDVFGPIVVCACYASLEDLEYLESLNVRDSKNLTNRMILQLGPSKYNSLVKEGMNLNKIKALLHNHMIIKTTSKVEKQVPVIVDQFCLPTHYFNYLKDEKLIYRDIEFHTKAESVHLSVAAASIIARYAFLVKMHEYSKHLNLSLRLGAAKEVDEQVKFIHENHGIETLEKVAKMNFKNVTKQIPL